MWKNVLLLCSTLVLVQAQIYKFESATVAESKSLIMNYVYFAYSMDEASDKSQGEPKIIFKNLKVTSSASDRPDSTLKDYEGIQLSVMRYEDFWAQVKPERMCSTQEDIAAGLAKNLDHLIINRPSGTSFDEVHVYRHQMRFGASVDQEKTVTKSGVYILVMSNCGVFDRAMISGSVILKNPHGYLPANEFVKLKFFLGLGGFYLVLLVIWSLLCCIWKDELLGFHKCILAVIVIGLLESALCYVFLMDWNSNGIRTQSLFGVAVLLSVLRTTTSYMMVLVACLGWGVTRAELDSSITCRIVLLSFSYIVLNFIREIVISFRHTHSLPMYFVMLCLLPVSLMNGGIFYWVFSALASLIENLQSTGQTEKLSVFQKLWWILICAIVFACATLLVQLFLFSKNAAHYWREQWLVTDLAPHAVFAFVLVAIMILWKPAEGSQRLAYSVQIGGDEEGAIGNAQGPDTADGSAWADEVVIEDEDKEDDSFWAGGKNQAQPAVIGGKQEETRGLD
eukprot:TRINITY_DN90828_c0_g1_i1.p1 TRINITY_DN90828_c0_g1~~TRINITY_DN90828_c0_g1_i1.p1  ORF type:complete len:509 (+),score=100.34 TRINITY_DN90828_c0_g1_i1:71-1597(+)